MMKGCGWEEEEEEEGGEEDTDGGGGGWRDACCVCQTRVCQFLATGHVLRHSLTATLYREDKDR